MLRCVRPFRSSPFSLARRATSRTIPRFTSSQFSSQAQSPSFLSGSASNYVDAQFDAWQRDPESVHPSWRGYFETGEFQAAPLTDAETAALKSAAPAGTRQSDMQDAIRMVQMVRSFQIRGHFGADLDPLGICKPSEKYSKSDQFDLSTYHFSEKDLDRTFNFGSHSLLSGFLKEDENHRNMTLGQIYNRLLETYCGTIGYQYMHLHSRDETAWIQDRIETPKKQEFTKEERLSILDRLTWAHHFEQFLAKKYTAQKRFGLDGLESLIPGMKAVTDTGADMGVNSVVLGMPHRGRLGVLSTVMRKPLEQIFSEFHGGATSDPDGYGTGDVKYHLGASTDRTTARGKTIHMSLVPNPSHLEAANTVVTGKARAKLDYRGDSEGDSVLALLLHGDAAFSAQGIVYETLIMTDLPDYTTGGVLHIVCNNQVGFTTDPQYARSAPYCTDVAKSIGAPIFHVNADDVESVVRVCRLAMEFRQKFNKDVVVDLIGYRKHGHNEGDEPRFTQPYMYSKIDKHTDSLTIYREKLIKEGVITAEEAKSVADRVDSLLNEAFERSKTYVAKDSDWLDANWAGFLSAKKHSAAKDTGVQKDTLRKVGKSLTDLPTDFSIHRRLKKVFDARANMIETGKSVDWGTAEGLAFGSLLLEGCHVRLSGEDVQRGTFSHRHAVVHDQLRHEPTLTHTPLQHLDGRKGQFVVSNSPLSEFGVLGYEYGYSLESPDSLVLWEAQFGDFANGAQIIFDQFISSGEAKWLRQSGIVVLLPHGYEAAGPEHSSARMERFLQMCDEPEDELPADPHRVIQNCNWQVVNCSTPANYFHVLRRQIHREFRKPLIVMSPKSLLKMREAVSSFEDMEEGTKFKTVIPERTPSDLAPKDKIRRLILCSGKVYYDLVNERKAKGIKDVAIVTVEQLSPFPFFDIEKLVADEYPNADVKWVQEEPHNMGAWTHVKPRFQTAVSKSRPVDITYAGRPASASPATGFGVAVHKQQIAEFMSDAFGK